MTDTYIWQKLRLRFLSIDAQMNGEDVIRKDVDSEGEVIDYTNVVEPNETKKREELKSKDYIWFEISPLRGAPRQAELGRGGRNRWVSGIQININSPRDLGTYDIETVYNFIADKFKRGDIFNGIRVSQTAHCSSAQVQEDFYSEPVTVMVEADLDN